MRIAWSCNGEGFGHAARMVAFSRVIERRHSVSYFVPKVLWGFLSEKIPGFTATDIPHIGFKKSRDRVDIAETVIENAPKALDFPRVVRRLVIQLKQSGIEAIISDFEPILAWAGSLAGIPVFQMNHPGIVSSCMTCNPLSWLHALGAKLMEGPWNRRAHISFFRGDVGPLFRPSLFRHRVHDGGYILLNLKPGYQSPVLHVLRNNPSVKFELFPRPGADFEAALAGCTAVISSAGHQMIAESLVLGKPMLALPQQGQWEQNLNAIMLEKTGRGMKSTLDKLEKDLPLFIRRLPDFKQATQQSLPEGFTLSDGTEQLNRRIEHFLNSINRPTIGLVRTTGTVTGFNTGQKHTTGEEAGASRRLPAV